MSLKHTLNSDDIASARNGTVNTRVEQEDKPKKRRKMSVVPDLDNTDGTRRDTGDAPEKVDETSTR